MRRLARQLKALFTLPHDLSQKYRYKHTQWSMYHESQSFIGIVLAATMSATMDSFTGSSGAFQFEQASIPVFQAFHIGVSARNVMSKLGLHAAHEALEHQGATHS